MNYRISIVLLCILVALAGILIHVTRNNAVDPISSSVKSLKIADTLVEVEVADTDSARQQGLSGREQLNPGTGMLFIFENSNLYGFWMKDMKFAIDIIWLDANMRVVHVESDVRPDTYPQTFTPVSPAQYVLEVPAGFAIEKGLEIGDSAELF